MAAAGASHEIIPSICVRCTEALFRVLNYRTEKGKKEWHFHNLTRTLSLTSSYLILCTAQHLKELLSPFWWISDEEVDSSFFPVEILKVKNLLARYLTYDRKFRVTDNKDILSVVLLSSVCFKFSEFIVPCWCVWASHYLSLMETGEFLFFYLHFFLRWLKQKQSSNKGKYLEKRNIFSSINFSECVQDNRHIENTPLLILGCGIAYFLSFVYVIT